MTGLDSIKDLPIGIALVDLNGDFLEVNETFAKMFYCEPMEFKTLSVAKVTHKDDLDRTAKLLGKCIQNPGEPNKIIKRYVKKTGATFYAQSTIKLIYDKNQIPRILVITDELKEGFDSQYSEIIKLEN